MLVPADRGAEDGARADFLPLFNAITRSTGFHFDVQTGQSYAAVIDGMCAGHAEIAWFGAASYVEARDRGCAELLGVDVTDEESFYYAAIFVKADSGLDSLPDIRNKSLALGSPHSTSSFIYPVAMLLAEGVDPARDLSAVRLTGSHANSLKALDAGVVDAAAASFESFERAVRHGVINPAAIKVLARSEPIPNPPLALRQELDGKLKASLRDALGKMHHAPGVTASMICGYGGKMVDRYDVSVTDAMINSAVEKMSIVNADVKASILAKSTRQ